VALPVFRTKHYLVEFSYIFVSYINHVENTSSPPL